MSVLEKAHPNLFSDSPSAVLAQERLKTKFATDIMSVSMAIYDKSNSKPDPDNLDLHTSNVRLDYKPTKEQEFVWRKYAPERQIFLQAAELCDVPHKTLDRIQCCGRNAWVVRDQETDQCVVAAFCCGSRCCPRCSGAFRARNRKVVEAAMDRIQSGEQQFVTLTLRSEFADLGKIVTRLQQTFRRLRASVFWLDKKLSGVAAIEMTNNEVTSLWHVHMHVLCKGESIDPKELSEVWKRLSGDSFIVDVERIYDKAGIITYIASYLSKSIEFSKRIDGLALYVEYFKAIQGRQLLIRFGEARCKGKEESKEHIELRRKAATTERKKRWLPLMRLYKLVALAKAGDAEATQIWNALNAPTAIEIHLRLKDVKPPIDGSPP